MRVTRVPILVACLALLATGTRLQAQGRRWVPVMDLPARPTAIAILDDDGVLVATAEGPSLTVRPALHRLDGDSIAWTLRLDPAKLPHFDYPHGEILDILLVGRQTALLAFQWGHSRRVDVAQRTSVEVPIRPVGGFARSVDGTIMGGTRYRSTDEGLTWDTIDPANRSPREFRFIEGSSGGVFYGAPDFGSVWRSSDGGVSWVEKMALTRTYDSLTGAGAPLFVFDENTVVLGSANSRTIEGTNHGLYRTSDAGESWHLALPLGYALGPVPFAREGTTAYVGFDTGTPTVYSTHDAGTTWQRVDDGLSSEVSPAVLAMRGDLVLLASFDEPYTLYRLEGTSGIDDSALPERMWLSTQHR